MEIIGEDMNYKQALEIVTDNHRNQVGKYDNSSFVKHPIAVADKFKKENFKIVAVSHALLKDTNLVEEDLFELGYPRDLIYVINLLTRKKNQTYLEYLSKLKKFQMARKIKIADIENNLTVVTDECTRDKYILLLLVLKNYTSDVM